MSNVTHAMLLLNESEDLVDLINYHVKRCSGYMNQTFGIITDFSTKDLEAYGLKGAGGSKSFCYVVAAAALNHVKIDCLVEAVDKGLKAADKPIMDVILVVIPEEKEPIFTVWSDVFEWGRKTR